MVVIEEAEHQMLLSLTDGHLGQDNYSLLILEALLSSKLMQRTKMEVLQTIKLFTGFKLEQRTNLYLILSLEPKEKRKHPSPSSHYSFSCILSMFVFAFTLVHSGPEPLHITTLTKATFIRPNLAARFPNSWPAEHTGLWPSHTL